MSFSAIDHACMARALELAERGRNTTHPNPVVGCVIARDGEVIGEGWHHRAGEAHAEVFALEQAGERVRGSTVYVTMEPCSHQGRTASCARALISAGVSRVVGATEDPNPVVDGNGFSMLRDAGIQVDTGLAREPAEALNPGFSKRMKHGRPWIRIKLATSLDGRTGLANGFSQWITSQASRHDVQSWRARSSAVMTGIGTLLKDDPSLNVRTSEVQRQPLRIVLDSRWRTPPEARTLGLPGQVLILGRDDLDPPSHLAREGVECLGLPAGEDGKLNLESVVSLLAEREMNEIQVESGGVLSGALLQSGLADEILIYQAPVILGSGGLDAFSTEVLDDMNRRIKLNCVDQVRIGPDLRLLLRPCSEPR